MCKVTESKARQCMHITLCVLGWCGTDTLFFSMWPVFVWGALMSFSQIKSCRRCIRQNCKTNVTAATFYWMCSHFNLKKEVRGKNWSWWIFLYPSVKMTDSKKSPTQPLQTRWTSCSFFLPSIDQVLSQADAGMGASDGNLSVSRAFYWVGNLDLSPWHLTNLVDLCALTTNDAADELGWGVGGDRENKEIILKDKPNTKYLY